MESNVYDIANELVNYSHRSIFLTGKAGTGKTTFLRRLKETTPKQMAVVAPTGVAAVNAGGSTIHSFFQIAPGTVIPTKEANYQFLAKQQVNAVRRKIYTALELLVIDEISMVRADLLDLIDVILRHYRYRPNEPFGGVQVMFIGDMHQLPPVCNGEDWQILQSFYASPYFFHSKVMQELQTVYVEFDKIFRQSNMQFVDLLNNVRNNSMTANDFELLNRRYMPDYEIKDEDGYILLTTHNAKADAVNSSKLADIEADSFYFDATVMKDFPEKNFPAEQRLQLKEGAKVMFIANDKQPEKRYYNGKIGVITQISSDEIYVQCVGDDESIVVERETWNNVKYIHDKQTNTIDEEISGSFTQYPLRLAWAITIHKSQGLTFEKAVIDAGHAFSSGQVYVALSRCTSLDGIVLTSQINPHSLAVDDKVVEYSHNKVDAEKLAEITTNSKYAYTYGILKDLFGFEDIHALVQDTVRYFLNVKSDLGEQSEQYLENFRDNSDAIYNVGQKFVAQLSTMFKAHADTIQERVTAASGYYYEKINELMALIEASPIITDSKTQAEDYVDKMRTIYEMLSMRLWIIVGVKNDCSVNNYFAVKSTYKVPKIKLIAYAGSTERIRIKTEHPELYKMLARERNSYCEEINMPVYVVGTTKMLVGMSNFLPQTHEELLRIKGFGKEKVKKYGDMFLAVIERYCKENGINAVQRFNFDEEEMLDSDIIKVEKPKKIKEPKEPKKAKEPKEPKKAIEPAEPKVSTLDVTLELLETYKNVEIVAEERGLAVTTIWSYALKLYEEGRLDRALLIDDEDVKKIVSAHDEAEDKSLKALHAFFDGCYAYGELKLALA